MTHYYKQIRNSDTMKKQICYLLAMFLLSDKAILSIVTAIFIIALHLIQAVFLKNGKVLEFYYDYPSLVSYCVSALAVIILLEAACGKANAFYRYKKIIKFTP